MRLQQLKLQKSNLDAYLVVVGSFQIIEITSFKKIILVWKDSPSTDSVNTGWSGQQVSISSTF
jgi:hypothetical protein